MGIYLKNFVHARWYTHVTGTRRIRLIVIHSMEMPDKPTTAEGCAHMFATTDRKASAHYTHDQNSSVQCVDTNDVAYGCPGINSDGIHHELAGYAAQANAEWLDAASLGTLAQAAKVCAADARRERIPVKKLTNAELKAGAKGFVGHVQGTEVYKISTHTDPGPGFPWTKFMTLVQAEYDALGGARWSVTKLSSVTGLAAAALVAAGVTLTSLTGSPTPHPTPLPTSSVSKSATSTGTATLPGSSHPTPSPTVTFPKPPTSPAAGGKSVRYPGPASGIGKGDGCPDRTECVWVKAIQAKLNALKVRSDDGRALVVDGQFGQKTKEAVVRYQKAHRLTPDGICGRLTWTALFR